MFVAFWGVTLLRGVMPAEIPRARQIGSDGTVLVFTAAASLLSGIVFGLAPAIEALRQN